MSVEVLIQAYGYVAVFVLVLLSSASIFYPIPSQVVVLAAAPFLNPVLLGIVAGAASALGELTGYFVGLGSKEFLEKRYKKVFGRWTEIFEKYGFWAIVLFGITPLPDDVVGILAGMAKYDVRKFLVANFIGKSIMYFLVAYFGQMALNFLFAL